MRQTLWRALPGEDLAEGGVRSVGAVARSASLEVD